MASRDKKNGPKLRKKPQQSSTTTSSNDQLHMKTNDISPTHSVSKHTELKNASVKMNENNLDLEEFFNSPGKMYTAQHTNMIPKRKRPTPRASSETHKLSQPSLLSMAAATHDYRGFMVLAVLALLGMHIRLVVENILKYGLLFSFRMDVSTNWDSSWPALLFALILWFTAPAVSYFIEYLRFGKKIKVRSEVVTMLAVIYICICFFSPLLFIWLTKSSIGPSFLLAFICVIVTMKLISHAHVSYDIAHIKGRVVTFSNGSIVPLDCDQAPEDIAEDLRERLLVEYQSKLQRIHTRSLQQLAVLQGNEGSIGESSFPMLNTSFSHHIVDPLSPASYSRSRHDRADDESLVPIVQTSKLCLNVSATYLTFGNHTYIELSNLPPPPPPLSYKVSFYCPQINHLYYFFSAPTLIYQPSYPQTDSIRVLFVVRRCVELTFIGFILIFMTEQYVKPTLHNSIVSFQNHDFLFMFERVLKLCVPNLIMWLLIFYAVFHSFLNLTAELTYFADRKFYSDWWNAGDMAEYWSLWNKPVHAWLAKHVYFTLLRYKVSSTVSKIVVFIISAILHEVVISIPCHIVTAHAFGGMLLQIPACYISEFIHKKTSNSLYGNVFFWVTFTILGQPLLLMQYFYAYFQTHGF